MTQSPDQVKALVHGSLKRGPATPQRHGFRQGSMGAAVTSVPSAVCKPGDAGGPSALDALPPLNTVLILPDGDEEIMRGMSERFDEVANAGGIRLRADLPNLKSDATDFRKTIKSSIWDEDMQSLLNHSGS